MRRRPLILLIGQGIVLITGPPLLGGLRREVGRRPQLGALGFLGGERRFGALGDEFALVLGKHGEDAHGKGIGVGQVAADKIHPRVAQLEDKACIAREPIQLGDEQRRALGLGQRNGRYQLRPRVFLTRLDLDEFPHQRRPPTKGFHRHALRRETQSRLASLEGGDTQVGDVGLYRNGEDRAISQVLNGGRLTPVK